MMMNVMMHDGASGAFLCSCTRLAGYDILRSLDRTCVSGSMAAKMTRSHTVGFFSMRQSQGMDVLIGSDYTNRPSCSSACYLYFGSHRATVTYALIHTTDSSENRYAR
ncbi:hypothetical protein TNCV_1454221 [Trichonephila clavipes]|nr:hypothetical protein TNCV_1454221 [Trichonephila clavipes]